MNPYWSDCMDIHLVHIIYTPIIPAILYTVTELILKNNQSTM